MLKRGLNKMFQLRKRYSNQKRKQTVQIASEATFTASRRKCFHGYGFFFLTKSKIFTLEVWHSQMPLLGTQIGKDFLNIKFIAHKNFAGKCDNILWYLPHMQTLQNNMNIRKRFFSNSNFWREWLEIILIKNLNSQQKTVG